MEMQCLAQGYTGLSYLSWNLNPGLYAKGTGCLGISIFEAQLQAVLCRPGCSAVLAAELSTLFDSGPRVTSTSPVIVTDTLTLALVLQIEARARAW